MEKEIKQSTQDSGNTPVEVGQARYRQFTGGLAILVKVLAATLCLFFLLYVSGVLPEMGVYFLSFQLNSIFLTVMLVLIFLLIPARGKASGQKIPWYDILLILTSVVAGVYIVANAMELALSSRLTADPLQVVLGTIALVVVLEGVRRTIGWPIVVVIFILLLHAKFSYLLPPTPFRVAEQNWPKIIATAYLGSGGLYGSLTGLAATTIFTFIAFGVFFMKVGAGQTLLNLALALTGHLRGGPAKAAIVGSALFGTLTSSPPANVAITGSVTIPMMKNTGYSPVFAGAVETVASTGGQIMPPVMGGTAFIMAALLGISYRSIALAAAIPAVLYYIGLFMQTDFRAANLGLRGVPRSELPRFWTTVKGGWEFALPFISLVVLLFVMRYPPPLAATYSIVVLIVISMFRKKHRLNLKGFIDALASSTKGMLIISPALAKGGVIVGLISMTGLGPRFAAGLVDVAGGSGLALLFLAFIASYLVGMGGGMSMTYILLAVLVAPAMVMTGMVPMVAHFFILFVGKTMFFTPPYAPAAFVAASIADAKPYAIGLQSMRLGIVSFIVPFIFVYNPALMLIGEPLEIVLAAVTAIIGVYALSMGVERYLFTKINWLQTIMAVVAGLAMMVPGLASDGIGIGLLALVFFWQWGTRKSRPQTGVAR